MVGAGRHLSRPVAALKGRRGRVVRKAVLARRARRVLLVVALRVRRAELVYRASRVRRAVPVRRGLAVLLGRKGRRARRAFRDHKAPGHKGRRARWARRVQALVRKERRGRRVHKGRPVAHKVFRGHRARLDQGHRARLERQAHKVSRAGSARRARQARREPPARRVLRGFRARAVCKDSKVRPATPGRRARQAHRELRARRVRRARPVRPVLVRKDHKVRTVLRGFKVREVRRGFRVRQETLARRDRQEPKVRPVFRARRDFRAGRRHQVSSSTTTGQHSRRCPLEEGFRSQRYLLLGIQATSHSRQASTGALVRMRARTPHRHLRCTAESRSSVSIQEALASSQEKSTRLLWRSSTPCRSLSSQQCHTRSSCGRRPTSPMSLTTHSSARDRSPFRQRRP